MDNNVKGMFFFWNNPLKIILITPGDFFFWNGEITMDNNVKGMFFSEQSFIKYTLVTLLSIILIQKKQLCMTRHFFLILNTSFLDRATPISIGFDCEMLRIFL